MKITGITEANETVEVDLANVKFFGVEIGRNKTKDDRFKSFQPYTWVKEGSTKIYTDDIKIGGLKKYFTNYSSDKRYHTEEKNGEVKRATEWICEVVEEGTTILHQEDYEAVQLANNKRRMFVYKNTEYFFLIPNLFRSNDDYRYYYFDEENRKLVSLEYTTTDYPNKETLLNAIEKYKEAI